MTTMLLDRVAAYAQAVRSHLADLGPETADELTDGLEADLAEELADRSFDRRPGRRGHRAPTSTGCSAPPPSTPWSCASAAGLRPGARRASGPQAPAARRARSTWRRLAVLG